MPDSAFIASLGRNVELRPKTAPKTRLIFSDFGGLTRCYAPGLDYGLQPEKALEIQEFRASLIVRPLPVERGTVAVYAHMVKCTVSQAAQPDWLRGVKRGTINADFGGKRRKRLFDKFNAWRMPEHRGRFVTLTYPDEYPLDWRIWKSDLETYRRALLRKYPNTQAIWRLELQRRGAPHFHIMLYTGQRDKLKQFRRWNDKVWARIAHKHDKYQGKYACQITAVANRGQAVAYLGKYCGKPGQSPVNDDGEIATPESMGDTMGRQWGTIGKPDCRPYAVADLPLPLTGIARRQMALYAQALGNAYGEKLWARPDNYSWTLYRIGQTPTRDMRVPGCDPPPAASVLTAIAQKAYDTGTWSTLLRPHLSLITTWDKKPPTPPHQETNWRPVTLKNDCRQVRSDPVGEGDCQGLFGLPNSAEGGNLDNRGPFPLHF